MNTCGKCHFYEGGSTATMANGDEFPAGACFGAPPSVTAKKVETPIVREDRRACALWRAIPMKASTTSDIKQMRNRRSVINTKGKTR